MPGGKPATWAARLRSLDVRFVRSVLNVWPRCLRVLPDRPEEDVITFNHWLKGISRTNASG